MVKAEGDGTSPCVLNYQAPELPLPHIGQAEFEARAVEAVKAWIPWQKRVSDLVTRMEPWGKDLGWATRRIEKNLDDSLLGKHQVPALLLQDETWRVLLEPIGRSAPGVEGVVDLYLLPAYDDIATLFFYKDGWNLHYLYPDRPPVPDQLKWPGEPLTLDALSEGA